MFLVEVQHSEVEGERRVIWRENVPPGSGSTGGTKFARSLDQAITEVEADLRRLQSCGIPMRESDIKDALDQVRKNWR